MPFSEMTASKAAQPPPPPPFPLSQPGSVAAHARPPFQMWQGLPLQHYTVGYSMRPNQQLPRARAEHGQATTEQTSPRSAAEPLVLSAPKALHQVTLREAAVEIQGLQAQRL